MSSATPASPSSPSSRKVVTDFAAFGAPKSASVFGTRVQSTPFSLAGGTAAFGAVRSKPPGMADDEDEDQDEQDGPQRVELREDSISLDQVRRVDASQHIVVFSHSCPGETDRNAERMEECSLLRRARHVLPFLVVKNVAWVWAQSGYSFSVLR
jgi:hypothetical protein